MDQPAWNADLLDWLASDFARRGYDLKHLLRLIMTSATYQLPAVSMQEKGETEGSPGEFVFHGPYFRRLTAEQFADSLSMITGEWRVQQPKEPVDAKYAREWQVKSSPLTRALGRAVRDQVITERNEAPTTLQALELVNGETLTRLVQRGARRLLGRLEPAPRPLFHSGVVGMKTWEGDKVSENTSFEVDVSGFDKLYLLTVDYDSYDRERVVPVWVDAQLIGPGGVTPLTKLAAEQGIATRQVAVDDVKYEKAIAGSLPTTHVFDLRGKNFKSFRARIAYADESKDVVIMPSARFFVFGEKPSLRELIPVDGEPPFPTQLLTGGPGEIVESLYDHAFARKPTEAEAREATQLIAAGDAPGQVSTEGLEDLLWILFLSPEFEFIR
jgi:hypothetical protein